MSGNIIYDNGTNGSGINMDGVQNSRSKTISSTTTTPAASRSIRSTAAQARPDNVVVNNTIHIADDGRWALNIQDGSTGNTAFNNILVSEHAFRGAIDISADSLTGFVSDYNVVDRRGSPPTARYFNLAQWRSANRQRHPFDCVADRRRAVRRPGQRRLPLARHVSAPATPAP